MESAKNAFKNIIEFFVIPTKDDKAQDTQPFFSFFLDFFENLKKAFPVEKKKPAKATTKKGGGKIGGGMEANKQAALAKLREMRAKN